MVLCTCDVAFSFYQTSTGVIGCVFACTPVLEALW